jgi:hypothetical protein
MFSSFLGKGKKPEGSQAIDAVDSRGLEVVEDDPDTTWGLWKSAVAEQDSRFSGAPIEEPLPDVSQGFLPTAPMPLLAEGSPSGAAAPRERTVGQRREDALQVVELHHHRVANTIRTLWGHKECSEYISKLIMDGGDSKGNARMGFHQDAAASMMVLSDLHDELFGVMQPGSGTGFSDFTVRTGYDGSR